MKSALIIATFALVTMGQLLLARGSTTEPTMETTEPNAMETTEPNTMSDNTSTIDAAATTVTEESGRITMNSTSGTTQRSGASVLSFSVLLVVPSLLLATSN